MRPLMLIISGNAHPIVFLVFFQLTKTNIIFIFFNNCHRLHITLPTIIILRNIIGKYRYIFFLKQIPNTKENR